MQNNVNNWTLLLLPSEINFFWNTRKLVAKDYHKNVEYHLDPSDIVCE